MKEHARPNGVAGCNPNAPSSKPGRPVCPGDAELIAKARVMRGCGEVKTAYEAAKKLAMEDKYHSYDSAVGRLRRKIRQDWRGSGTAAPEG